MFSHLVRALDGLASLEAIGFLVLGAAIGVISAIRVLLYVPGNLATGSP